MTPIPMYRVIVHPTKKGWTWTQVARNGSAGAVAPRPFDNKANAKRAGQRQVNTLTQLAIEVAGPVMSDDSAGELTQSDVSRFVQLVVLDKDPGYV